MDGFVHGFFDDGVGLHLLVYVVESNLPCLFGLLAQSPCLAHLPAQTVSIHRVFE